jgi:hypothetical protein
MENMTNITKQPTIWHRNRREKWETLNPSRFENDCIHISPVVSGT